MSKANDFIVVRRFGMDSREQNYNSLVEARKKSHEEDARQELDARMGQSLADYQMRSSWTVEKIEESNIHQYTLTMKVIFKP